MRGTTLSVGFAAALALAPPLTAELAAQTERPATEVYALTNARIVVAPGRVIEQGTVVIREGRIQAVGARVQPPADAHRLDLSGLTVYPGLIDAASTIGMPRPQPAPSGFAAAMAATAAADTAAPPDELRADRVAAEAFAGRAADLEALRAVGFTAVGVAFEGGIFPGRASLLSAGAPAGASPVLRQAVAQQVAFGSNRRGYPNTLMGALAYIRQAFHDAGHHRRTEQAFARDPGAVRRAAHVPQNAALAPAATRELPAWIAASRQGDIRRAVELAGELNLDYYILGAQEGYQAAELLARERRPVLVSLDYPRLDQVTGRAFEMHVAPVSGPDRARETADTAAAHALRGNAAALVQAGVPIALVSHGLARPGEFRDRIRGAIEAGLPADEALRALTVTPARVLGMERSLGTVDAGKLANLVVAEGDLFAREPDIRHVFVEGQRFDVPRPRPRPAERPDRPDAPREALPGGVVTAAGEWLATATAPEQTFDFTLRLEQAGTHLSGELASAAGSSHIEGEITADRLVLRGMVLISPELPPVPVTLSGTVERDQMSGTAEVVGVGTVPFTANRAPGGPR